MASPERGLIESAPEQRISYPAKRIPRPKALPVRRRIDAFIDAYIGLGVSRQATPLAAARLAGWLGSPAAVSRRASRALNNPLIRAEIERRLEARLSAVPSAQMILAEMGHLAMDRSEGVKAAWWRTNAKVKALEFLGKHYGLASESLIVREMPKDVGAAAHVVAHELVRLGLGAGGKAVFGPAEQAPAAAPDPQPAARSTGPDTPGDRPIAPAGVYDVAAAAPLELEAPAEAPAAKPKRRPAHPRKPSPKARRKARSARRR